MSAEQSQSSWVPTNPLYDPGKPMQIGGQAVIEGVMMRAPGSVATAVRRANGRIVVKHESFRSLIEKYKFLNMPVLRGAVGLIDMMYLGIRTLNYSAEIAMMDVEAEEASKNGNGKPKETKKQGQSTLALVGTLVFALGLGITIFFVTPIVVTSKVFELEQKAFEFNFVAGLIRISILLAYLAAISLMKDIKRLFQYHGAEHKAVFAFELSDLLVPSVVQRHTRFHPRCGTSFLLIVMFVAIISFSILDALLIGLLGELTMLVRLLTHLPFIPVVGGIAYEFIKFSAKYGTTWWGKILIAPGLWLQRITTKEPDESQLEVAIVALRCALGLDDPGKYTLESSSPVEAISAPAVK
ncbi:MAG: DUF1385 domain-containing protein [Ignavibacteriales bacterium]|nr:DUF1385 domain-containing protein [Ignavibacteriales bacterium]